MFTMTDARAAADAVGLSPGYVAGALHHLARAGWVVRVRRGLYALASVVPGVSPLHEFEVAMALVSPAAISHWSAMSYHGLTDQAPHRVFVLTTTDATPPSRRGERGYRAGDVTYQFVQAKPDRFFGTQTVWIGEARVTLTDPERTLLDGLTMPRYCGDFAEVLHAFEVRGPALDVARIVAYARRLDAATAKRLGWVLEHQGVAPSELAALERISILGYRTLDPTGPRSGPYNRRWMIQENLPGKVSP